MIIFEKKYDGESIYDTQRDVFEAFDSKFNPIAKDIPQDKYGFQQGTFTVKIEWSAEE